MKRKRESERGSERDTVGDRWKRDGKKKYGTKEQGG